MEIRLEGVLVDTRLSDNIDMLLPRLYELHHHRAQTEKEEEYSLGELEKEVLDALEEKRFSIGFWPVCCEEEEIYDTAVKLTDSNGKFIHQNRYVPILNRFGKMRILESDVLEKIARLCDEKMRRFIVFVSPSTLRNPHFFEYALTLTERYPHARDKITLMFEEKEYCHQADRFAHQISQYRKAGYKTGIDRLGGYHTSMLYLKEFEFDVARFDLLYSRHPHEEKYQHLLQGLNLSAHLFGVKTWISLIEDDHADRIARSLKINYREGNYLGKILTIKEIQG